MRFHKKNYYDYTDYIDHVVDRTPSLASRLIAVVMMSLLTCGFLLFLVSHSCRCDGPQHSWDTTCKWGGLLVTKGDVALADGNCDSVHTKEDWQPPQPEIKFPAAQDDRLYTVLALNPDATDHPEGSYYLHMLHTNVKGSGLKNGDFSGAFSIADYVGPALSEGEGIHRYMFVVYQHEPDFVIGKMEVPVNLRWMFNLKNWLDQYGSGLTGPVAGVQFKTGYSKK